MEDRADVQTLGKVEGSSLMITFDLNAKEPVEFAKIGNLHMLGDLNLKVSDQHNRYGCNCAVINMNKHNDDGSALMIEEDCLVNVASLEP